MSLLIDKLTDAKTEIDGKWYISKPIYYFRVPYLIKETIKLWQGKCITVHFKEDEQSSQGEG